MSLSVAEIEDMIREWCQSPEGKKQISETIASYRRGEDSYVNSSGKTHGGSVIVTYKQMQAAANDFLSMLRKHAASAGLPSSVMEHVESFTASPLVVNKDGTATIDINMLDNPHRESLQPENYRGADNIVALFNVGYKAPGAVYGTWQSKGIDTWSLSHREGSFFLQAAVNEFNAKYGAKYNVTVSIDGQYEKR